MLSSNNRLYPHSDTCLDSALALHRAIQSRTSKLVRHVKHPSTQRLTQYDMEEPQGDCLADIIVSIAKKVRLCLRNHANHKSVRTGCLHVPPTLLDPVHNITT